LIGIQNLMIIWINFLSIWFKRLTSITFQLRSWINFIHFIRRFFSILFISYNLSQVFFSLNLTLKQVVANYYQKIYELKMNFFFFMKIHFCFKNEFSFFMKKELFFWIKISYPFCCLIWNCFSTIRNESSSVFEWCDFRSLSESFFMLEFRHAFFVRHWHGF
jgi:hypothetical protein